MREKERTTEGRREGKTSLQTDNLNKKNTKTQKHKNKNKSKVESGKKDQVQQRLRMNWESGAHREHSQ